MTRKSTVAKRRNRKIRKAMIARKVANRLMGCHSGKMTNVVWSFIETTDDDIIIYLNGKPIEEYKNIEI